MTNFSEDSQSRLAEKVLLLMYGMNLESCYIDTNGAIRCKDDNISYNEGTEYITLQELQFAKTIDKKDLEAFMRVYILLEKAVKV